MHPTTKIHLSGPRLLKKSSECSYPPWRPCANPVANMALTISPQHRIVGACHSKRLCTLMDMEDRKKLWLKAAVLTLLPVASIFPVLAAAHFGPAGPATVWPVAVYAPVAMWMQTRAMALLLGMYRNRRDPVLLAILPLGLVSLYSYALAGVIFVLALPSFLATIPLS
jgi:hypothetical protein